MNIQKENSDIQDQSQNPVSLNPTLNTLNQEQIRVKPVKLVKPKISSRQEKEAKLDKAVHDLKNKKHPKDRSWVFGRLFFFWINPIISIS